MNEQQLQELIAAARNGATFNDQTFTSTCEPASTASAVNSGGQQSASTPKSTDVDSLTTHEFASEISESNRALDALLAACNEIGLVSDSTRDVDVRPTSSPGHSQTQPSAVASTAASSTLNVDSAASTVTSVTAAVVTKQTPMKNVMIPVDDRTLSMAQYAAHVIEAVGGRTAKYFAKVCEENEERKRMFKEAAANHATLTVLNNRECEEKVNDAQEAYSRSRCAAVSRKRRIQAILNEISSASSDSDSDVDDHVVEDAPALTRGPTSKAKKPMSWPTRVTTCTAPRSDGAKCLWVECGHGNLRYHISHFHDCEFDRSFFNEKKMMTQAEWDERWAKWRKQSDATKKEKKMAAVNSKSSTKKK